MWSQALMAYPMCTHTAESARIRRKDKPWTLAFLCKLGECNYFMVMDFENNVYFFNTKLVNKTVS
jgi:hypothetical protein